MTASSVVDWAAAGTAAGVLAPPGPALSRAEIDDLVAELRTAALVAHGPVAQTARLAAPPPPPPLVVDRAGWARANAASFGALVDPILATSSFVERAGDGAPPFARRVGTGQTGALLAFLATKVLGQYDIFGPSGGRLLLVAPNIAQVEIELGAVPTDFRTWICLHEETHRVQFGANPWLAGWLTGQVRDLLGDLLAEPSSTASRLFDSLGRLPELLRAPADGAPPSPGLIDLVQSPAQRERLDALVAVMSLLEGHADVVMDDVGPAVVPSVAQIRARFGERRKGTGPIDRLVRRALGLEAKAAQYRDGAAFVRAVVAEVGIDGFNAVWTSPETLPTPTDIADAAAWVRRVHG